MTSWFNCYHENGPHSNVRLNPFVIDFDNPSIDFNSSIFDNPLENAKQAIDRIVNKFEGPYILLASGGVDSQALIWCWEQSGVDYEIWHYDYCGWNYHDTEYLLEFLEKVQLKHKLKIKTFDAVNFIDSPELIEYAKKYDTSSPQILTYIKFAEQTPGTVIQSGNFLQKEVAGISHTLYALQNYADKERPNYFPFFFQHDPILAYSFFKKDHELTYSNHKKHRDQGYDAKCETYEFYGFPIIRQNEKYTGFEKIKKLFDSEPVNSTDKLRWINEESKRPFDILYRYNLYNHIGYYNNKVIIRHNSKINNLLRGE